MPGAKTRNLMESGVQTPDGKTSMMVEGGNKTTELSQQETGQVDAKEIAFRDLIETIRADVEAERGPGADIESEPIPAVDAREGRKYESKSFKDLSENGQQRIENVKSSIKSGFGKLWGAAKSLVSGAKAGFAKSKDFGGQAVLAVASAPELTRQGIDYTTYKAGEAKEYVGEKVSNTIDAAKDKYDDLQERASNRLNQFKNGLQLAYKTRQQRVFGFFDGLADKALEKALQKQAALRARLEKVNQEVNELKGA